MSIYKKLLQIQTAITSLSKDKDTTSTYNPKGYKYVTGDKIIGVIKPLMNELGLILKPEVLSMTNTPITYLTSKGQEKTEVLCEINMRFTWIDTETGEKDENLWGATGMNDFDKGFGSASTYGSRYFLLKYFLISTDEDDVDANVRDYLPKPATQTPATPNPTPQQQEKPWITPKQAEAAAEWMVKDGKGIEDVKKKYRISKVNEELINKKVVELKAK